MVAFHCLVSLETNLKNVTLKNTQAHKNWVSPFFRQQQLQKILEQHQEELQQQATRAGVEMFFLSEKPAPAQPRGAVLFSLALNWIGSKLGEANEMDGHVATKEHVSKLEVRSWHQPAQAPDWFAVRS